MINVKYIKSLFRRSMNVVRLSEGYFNRYKYMCFKMYACEQ